MTDDDRREQIEREEGAEILRSILADRHQQEQAMRAALSAALAEKYDPEEDEDR